MITKLPTLSEGEIECLYHLIKGDGTEWLVGRGSEGEKHLREWTKEGWFVERTTEHRSCAQFAITPQGRAALSAYFDDSRPN